MGDGGAMARARLLACAAIVLVAGAAAGRAATQSTPDVTALIARVGDRIAGYHQRAQTIVCIETATVQPIATNWSWEGMARTVESELRMEPDATVRREIRAINGRLPRDRDKKDRAGCTDPDPLSAEPLAFLMTDGREAYRFTAVHETRERNQAALAIDFTSANVRSRAALIEDTRGHDNCFDWSGPIATRGRVWVDAETYDVLRVERHNTGPVDLQVSWTLQRRYGMDAWFVLERDDLTLRYKPVRFSDPDEIVVLPESIDSITVVRNGLQSTRRTTTFSDYRRFLTGGRVRTAR